MDQLLFRTSTWIPVACRKFSVFYYYSSGCHIIVSIISACNHSAWGSISNIITITSTRHHWCKSPLSIDKNGKVVGLVQFEIYGTELCAWEFLYLLEAVELSQQYTIAAEVGLNWWVVSHDYWQNDTPACYWLIL